jgi:hypothetical protein
MATNQRPLLLVDNEACGPQLQYSSRIKVVGEQVKRLPAVASALFSRGL